MVPAENKAEGNKPFVCQPYHKNNSSSSSNIDFHQSYTDINKISCYKSHVVT